jgi:hypothetical protein
VNGNTTAIATSNTAKIEVTVNTSIIDFEEQNALKIYPNPFFDEIHIVNAEVGSTLYVLNTGGFVVHTQRITSSVETIRLGHLPNGVYIFQVGNNTVRGLKQ